MIIITIIIIYIFTFFADAFHIKLTNSYNLKKIYSNNINNYYYHYYCIADLEMVILPAASQSFHSQLKEPARLSTVILYGQIAFNKMITKN